MRTGLIMLAMMAAPPVFAQEPAPVCVKAGDLPAELAAWNAPGKVGADGQLALGTRADVALAANIAFATTTRKPPKPGSFGGSTRFVVARAGTYRVALGGPVWIDVVQGGKAITSSAHGHGPLCTGVRKTVDFALTPGTYTLQLSGNAVPQAAVMVVALP